jgi:hypothetical protein
MEELPEGWRPVSYSEIFTKEQSRELADFLKRKQKEKASPYDIINGLSEMFSRWRADLEAKGILPEYLAYALALMVAIHGYDRVMFELKRKRRRQLEEEII